jgi:hypothetical protein
MECETIYRYTQDLQPITKFKIKFDTLEEAIEQCKIINSQKYRIGKVVSYKCSKCHKYHIGKNGKKLKQ